MNNQFSNKQISNFLFFIFILNSSAALCYNQNPVGGFNNTGWGTPLSSNKMTTDDCCTFNSSIYENSWGFKHAGVDVGMDNLVTNESVYAISDGTIIARKLHCNNIGSGNPTNLKFISNIS